MKRSKVKPKLAVVRDRTAEKEDKGPLIPAKKLEGRYGVSIRTVTRWLTDDRMKFPRPVVINRRRYFRETELVEWERSRATRAGEAA